jgi:hypothetical protein
MAVKHSVAGAFLGRKAEASKIKFGRFTVDPDSESAAFEVFFGNL